MRQSATYKRFLLIFLSIIGSVLFVIGAFNVLVDPFSVYQTPLIPKINMCKIDLGMQERLYKATQIARQKPQVILLGSSRVMVGLNPDEIESVLHLPTYNGAFSGANMEEIYHYFEHALYHQPDLKAVVIGLDLFGFRQESPYRGFPMSRLKTSTIEWNNRLSCLFNKASLVSSCRTLHENFFGDPMITYLHHGQQNPEISDRQRAKRTIEDEWKLLKQMVSSRDFYDGFRLSLEKIEYFKKIVDICREKGIELRAFFCPTKAVYWEALYLQGLWPELESLKRHLCQIYPIWDFSGFNCVTTQALESQDEPFYFECSHFRPQVIGKAIIAKLFDLQPSTELAGFGLLLKPDTVEMCLNQINQDRLNWQEERSDLVKEVRHTLSPPEETQLTKL